MGIFDFMSYILGLFQRPVIAGQVVTTSPTAVAAEGSLLGSAQRLKAKRRLSDTFINLIRLPCRFAVRALKSDWKVAACSLVAATPANLLTAFAVVYSAPWFASIFGGEYTAGYSIATAAVAIAVGYTSYLTNFYALMAYKDRDLFRDPQGRFDRKAFLSVMLIDFCLHIPSDIYTITRMGAVQLGCYQSGAFNLFWSVMIGQTVNDLPDSLKEILYWRGAKELYQAARHKENGKERGIVGVIYQAVSQAKKGRLDDLETTVANTDAVEVSSDTANEQRVA